MYGDGTNLLTCSAVSTRTLIVLALLAGLAILIAFAAQVSLLSR
jgi:hypothetical protein